VKGVFEVEPKTFTILSQTQRPKLNAMNRIEQVYIITIQSLMGGTGTLEIPVDLFEQMTDVQIKDLFNEKARQLDRAYMV